MFFLVKPEYNRTFYRRLKTLKKAIGGHQKPLQRTLEGSTTNLGGFSNEPWRVRERTLEGQKILLLQTT